MIIRVSGQLWVGLPLFVIMMQGSCILHPDEIPCNNILRLEQLRKTCHQGGLISKRLDGSNFKGMPLSECAFFRVRLVAMI
jgi:hypothetical protein